MALILEIANLMLDRIGHHHATDWPLTPEALLCAKTVATVAAAEFAITTFTQTSLAEASA
jgi:nitrogenase molybdenum-iron protein NifN